MNKPDPLPPQVIKQVADTLDSSVEQLRDDATMQLAQIREQALAKKHNTFKPKLAIAASICVILLIPLMINHKAADPISTNENEAYYAVDPEMLETMDMLAAIGEFPGV